MNNAQLCPSMQRSWMPFWPSIYVWSHYASYGINVTQFCYVIHPNFHRFASAQNGYLFPRFRFHSFVLTLCNHVNCFQPFLLVFWLFEYLLEKFCEVYARVWYLLRPCLVKNNPEKKTTKCLQNQRKSYKQKKSDMANTCFNSTIFPVTVWNLDRTSSFYHGAQLGEQKLFISIFWR